MEQVAVFLEEIEDSLQQLVDPVTPAATEVIKEGSQYLAGARPVNMRTINPINPMKTRREFTDLSLSTQLSVCVCVR